MYFLFWLEKDWELVGIGYILLGIWDLFKLVNIRWFFLCSVYIFRVCSIIDMVGGFVCISFCLLFLLSFGEKNKTKVVV